MARRKPAIGGGQRFQKLTQSLSSRGAKNPAGLAAWIGRKKYGKARFQQLSEAGRRHRTTTAPPGGETRVRV